MGGAIAGTFFLFTKLETDTKTSISKGKAETAAAISEGKAETAAAIAGVKADIALVRTEMSSFRTEMLSAFHPLRVELRSSIQVAQDEHRANQAEFRAEHAQFNRETHVRMRMRVRARVLRVKECAEPAAVAAADAQTATRK